MPVDNNIINIRQWRLDNYTVFERWERVRSYRAALSLTYTNIFANNDESTTNECQRENDRVRKNSALPFKRRLRRDRSENVPRDLSVVTKYNGHTYTRGTTPNNRSSPFVFVVVLREYEWYIYVRPCIEKLANADPGKAGGGGSKPGEPPSSLGKYIVTYAKNTF